MDWIWKAPLIGIVAYLAFCAIIYFMQPGMLYYPDTFGRELTSTPETIGLAYEEVNFITEDKVKLHGWFIPASTATQNTILFFHGNAGNVSHRLDSIRFFHRMNVNVFIFDYRGYGRSAGKTTEKGTYLDAKAAWHYLLQQKGIKSRNIVIFGRSLGGSIASWLAAKVKPAGLIVESSFSTFASMGKRLYPYLPVSLISRFNYTTSDYVSAIKCPVLIAHSPQDDIIPYAEGRDIFESAPEPKQFLQMRGGHNDGFLMSGDVYQVEMQKFVTASLTANE